MGISSRHLRFRRGFPVFRACTARLHPKGTSSRFALRAPRPLRGLAMTHQVVRRCTSALLPLNGSVQGGHYPQGARRIRKAAKPPTAAQGTPLQSNLAAYTVGDAFPIPAVPSRDCHGPFGASQ